MKYFSKNKIANIKLILKSVKEKKIIFCTQSIINKKKNLEFFKKQKSRLLKTRRLKI